MSRRQAQASELLGAHVSTQGGVHTAPARAEAIGATAIQVFTKTPNQWREPTISPAERELFQREMKRTRASLILWTIKAESTLPIAPGSLLLRPVAGFGLPVWQ